MLKKPASGVLGSSKSSTYRFEILGGQKCWRGFSVRQDPLYGRTAPQSAVGTSSGFDSPPPCLGQGASRRARVGRVRSLDFLSILFGILLLLSISADQVA